MKLLYVRLSKTVILLIALLSTFSISIVFKMSAGSPSVFHHRLTLDAVHDERNANEEYDTVNFRDFIEWRENTSFYLREDNTEYFHVLNGSKCLKEGTKFVWNTQPVKCCCKATWSGGACSIPFAVSVSDYPKQYPPQLMDIPRRIIYVFPFFMEFDLLEVRMLEYGNVVDLYVIVESNYTNFGTPKERYLRNKLRSGFLKSFHHKIIYLPLDYFPEGGLENGWLPETHMRNSLGDRVLFNLKQLRQDDIVVSTDADEVPTKEMLLFLKLHHGYPQPMGFHLHHNIFGYFYTYTPQSSRVNGACSVAFLRDVFGGKINDLRGSKNLASLALRNKHHAVHQWSFGAAYTPIGWHCSYCYDSAGIRAKLLATQADDPPRYGSLPEKSSTEFIEYLIAIGMWFDEKLRLTSVTKVDELYAPQYVLSNFQRFHNFLLIPHGEKEHVTNATRSIKPRRR